MDLTSFFPLYPNEHWCTGLATSAEFTRTFEWGARADPAAVLLMMALFFWLLATRLEGG